MGSSRGRLTGVEMGVEGVVLSPMLRAGEGRLSPMRDDRGELDPMSWSCSAMSWKNFWSAASWTWGTAMLPIGFNGEPGTGDAAGEPGDVDPLAGVGDGMLRPSPFGRDCEAILPSSGSGVGR